MVGKRVLFDGGNNGVAPAKERKESRMRIPWLRRRCVRVLCVAAGLSLGYGARPAGCQNVLPPMPPPAACVEPLQRLILSEGASPNLPPPQPEPVDKPLPINLATALRLADARPLVIAAAQASLRTAVAQYDEAKVAWLPNVYVGA